MVSWCSLYLVGFGLFKEVSFCRFKYSILSAVEISESLFGRTIEKHGQHSEFIVISFLNLLVSYL